MRSKNPFSIFYESNEIRDGEVDFSSRSKEVTETFLVGEKPSLWLGQAVSKSKMKIFLLILVALFFIYFGRLVYIQFLKGGEFKILAEGNRLKIEHLSPIRGIIFDRFGNPLVENVATFSLFINNFELKLHPEQKETIIKVFKELNLDDNQIEEIFTNEKYDWLPVKESLSYEQALTLMLESHNLSAIKVKTDPQRKYMENSALAGFVGYTSRITGEEKDYYLDLGYQLTEKIGRTGLEEYYQEELRGVPGKKQIEVDSLGIEKKVIAEQSSEHGQNIFLGIDLPLQQEIYKSLKQRAGNLAGAVVALDPNNGKVRAYVSWPTFDNNEFAQGVSQDYYGQLTENILKPLFNRVIGGEYPSGSTIKLIMGTAGLEEKLINKSTSFLSVGGVWYDKWFFPDWKAGGHGRTNIIKAISESVNTFFYYLGLDEFEGVKGLGLDRIINYFRKFGLGEKLGIDINGEKTGFLPSPEWKEETKGEIWYPGDTLHLAIGQGDLLVTPLQVAGYTSVIANKGILYQPQLVGQITNPESNKTTFTEPKIIKDKIAKKENIEIIAEGMRDSVLYGSSRKLYFPDFAIAAKTGTAQVGGDKLPHAWITAFWPYNNPSLVLTVLIENGGDGSDIAALVARDIAEWYYQNRILETQEPVN